MEQVPAVASGGKSRDEWLIELSSSRCRCVVGSSMSSLLSSHCALYFAFSILISSHYCAYINCDAALSVAMLYQILLCEMLFGYSLAAMDVVWNQKFQLPPELLCHCTIPAPHLELIYRHNINYAVFVSSPTGCCYPHLLRCVGGVLRPGAILCETPPHNLHDLRRHVTPRLYHLPETFQKLHHVRILDGEYCKISCIDHRGYNYAPIGG